MSLFFVWLWVLGCLGHPQTGAEHSRYFWNMVLLLIILIRLQNGTICAVLQPGSWIQAGLVRLKIWRQDYQTREREKLSGPKWANLVPYGTFHGNRLV